jgi:hypothetical protein
MSDVVVHLNHGFDLVSRPSDGAGRVVGVVEASLRAAGGVWHATVTPSAGLERFWVVQITRGGPEGPTRSVGYDERSPRPAAQLLQAIAEMARDPLQTDGEIPSRSRTWVDPER